MADESAQGVVDGWSLEDHPVQGEGREGLCEERHGSVASELVALLSVLEHRLYAVLPGVGDGGATSSQPVLDSCKNGGWQTNHPTNPFKNQGACIAAMIAAN